MEPIVIVLTFAVAASGLAILRVVADNRQSNRALRPPRVRRGDYAADPTADRFRTAAETLHRLRER
jgi:hypothetical protein